MNGREDSEGVRHILPGWRVIQTIGTGSYGKVYEVEKESTLGVGGGNRSAIKVISIPPDSDEYVYYIDNGYDEKSITAMFRQQLAKVDSEFKILEDLKGNSNIVSYEDHDVREHEDQRGWDVFIRMELLTTLPDYLNPSRPKRDGLKTPEITDDLVVQLGSDLCCALELCQKHNVIHRDIKPSNIFVNKDTLFKLGDFGIARMAAEKTRGTARMGTPDYMAPEVYNGKSYDHRADICSLGLVLYWLLNERRTPFLPLDGTVPTPDEKQRALNRRMQGEILPPPKNGSSELQAVVLKSCAWNPKERYSTPVEFRNALHKATKNSFPKSDLNEEEHQQKLENSYLDSDQDSGTQRVILTSEMVQYLEVLPAQLLQRIQEAEKEQIAAVETERKFFETALKNQEEVIFDEISAFYTRQIKELDVQFQELENQLENQICQSNTAFDLEKDQREKDIESCIKRRDELIYEHSKENIQALNDCCVKGKKSIAECADGLLLSLDQGNKARCFSLVEMYTETISRVEENRNQNIQELEAKLNEIASTFEETIHKNAATLVQEYAKAPGWGERGTQRAEELTIKGQQIFQELKILDGQVIQDIQNQYDRLIAKLSEQRAEKEDLILRLTQEKRDSFQEISVHASETLGERTKQSIFFLEEKWEKAAQKIERKREERNKKELSRAELQTRLKEKRKPILIGAVCSAFIVLIIIIALLQKPEIRPVDDFSSTVMSLVENKETSLQWNGQELSDLSVLSECTILKSLELTDNKITDISPLSSLKNLEELRLNQNYVVDISCIDWSKFPNLSLLNLSDNPVMSFEPLRACKNLRTLALTDCDIEDVTFLSDLDKLENLYLTDNQISDLTPLTSLTNLKSIYLHSNPDLSAEQVHMLKNVLPNCDIHYDRVKAEGINVSPTVLTFSSTGKESKISFALSPVNADADVVWESSNPSIATVDNKGTVRAVAVGSCTITASADSASATATVTVSLPPQSNSVPQSNQSNNTSKSGSKNNSYSSGGSYKGKSSGNSGNSSSYSGRSSGSSDNSNTYSGKSSGSSNNSNSYNGGNSSSNTSSAPVYGEDSSGLNED